MKTDRELVYTAAKLLERIWDESRNHLSMVAINEMADFCQEVKQTFEPQKEDVLIKVEEPVKKVKEN